MLLLPDEPAGAVPMRTAGAVELLASLTWRAPEEMTPGPVLPASETATVRSSVTEADEPETCTRRVRALIRALEEPDLTAALDAALRAVNETAALTEALLEARAARIAPPRAFSATARKSLTRDLKDAGFPVRSAPAWTPAPAADIDVALGIRGAEEGLVALLEGHPSWRTVSPAPAGGSG